MGFTPETIWVCDACGHLWREPADVADPSYCGDCDDQDLSSFPAEDYEDAEAFAQNAVETGAGAFS